MDKTISAIPLTYGKATGEVLFLDEPISFWGGVDLDGVIAEERHPQYKASCVGKVLVMTSSRGSSSGSFCLMELMRKNLAPVAIVITEPDGVICTGVLVGKETFGMDLPVIEVNPADLLEFKTGQNVRISSEIGHAEAIIKSA